jgi:hypothetical protein
MPDLTILQYASILNIDLMSRESAGAILGDGTVTTFTRPDILGSVDAAGFKWTHLMVPDGIGRRVRAVTYYEPVTVEVALISTMVDGTDYLRQIVRSNTNDQIAFPLVFPTRLDVWVLPGVFMAFDWLLLL